MAPIITTIGSSSERSLYPKSKSSNAKPKLLCPGMEKKMVPKVVEAPAIEPLLSKDEEA